MRSLQSLQVAGSETGMPTTLNEKGTGLVQ